MQNFLKIQNLFVSVDKKTVVSNFSLIVQKGEVHVIMGPNGSGKSSLALALMGHHSYQVKGAATIGNHDLLTLTPDQRAKMGLFLSFQNPVAVQGVTLGQLIFSSCRSIQGEGIDIKKFYRQIKKKAGLLGLKEEILERDVNDGFSGGEKKKAEMLIALCLNPKFLIFDEIDSGLDADAFKKVALAIKNLSQKAGVILITHNPKILKFIKVDFVHIFKEGEVIKSGKSRLVLEIEEKGYAKI
ncbi:MAG: Fe-S cluster assembly ATPase SufC [Candidatus Daviesbacteria bacterium]|nr:Fe-S cluster assembly ATPase SufC [Candidatus Daviesbacteria bacterium]